MANNINGSYFSTLCCHVIKCNNAKQSDLQPAKKLRFHLHERVEI